MMNGGARRPAEPEGRAASPHAAAKRKNQFERNAEMTKKKLMMMVVAVAAYPPREASAEGISPERSENCEAISLEVCSMRGAFGA